jgi:hypothetical protein
MIGLKENTSSAINKSATTPARSQKKIQIGVLAGTGVLAWPVMYSAIMSHGKIKH